MRALQHIYKKTRRHHDQTSTEIYNTTKRWTLETANEYLQIWMQENSIEQPTWIVDKVNHVYLIVNRKTGRVLKNYVYRRLSDLIFDIEYYGWTYKVDMLQKAA